MFSEVGLLMNCMIFTTWDLLACSQEEFVGTEGLATHVFTSQEIGLRSRHLGFHKALCALMGWKSAEKPNVTWSPEKLSDVENLTLKEDLILWPPVVIIHNSTIGNKSPDQQVIISIEEFETKLRGTFPSLNTKHDYNQSWLYYFCRYSVICSGFPCF